MKYINCFGIWIFLAVLVGCDLQIINHDISDSYIVTTDPEGCKTLYYKSKDGLDFERIRCVEKIWIGSKYLISKTGNRFQTLNMSKDVGSDLGDTVVKSSISKLLNKAELKKTIDSLKIDELKIVYEK